MEIPQDMIDEYDSRALELKDEDFDKIEIIPAEVKQIQNIQSVPGFWLKSMLNHPEVQKKIEEKDRKILGNVIDITCILH